MPDLPRVEAAIVQETNAFRAAEKRSPVTVNPVLAKVAGEFAAFLAASGRFGHEADGRKPADRTRAAGYKHCSIAENLASVSDSRGIATDALVTRMIEGWKASPGHRAAMVMPEVTEIGVGLAASPREPRTWVAVQVFGRPEAFRYTFRIENAASDVVHYSFNGTASTVPVRTVIEHTACTGGAVRIEGIADPLMATNGSVYRVTGRAGALAVEEGPPSRSR